MVYSPAAVGKEKTSFAFSTDGSCIKTVNRLVFRKLAALPDAIFVFPFKSKSGRTASFRLLGLL